MTFKHRTLLLLASASVAGLIMLQTASAGDTTVRLDDVSMIPTIAKSNLVTITPISNPKSVHQGDLVVFKHPANNRMMLKRLIGVGGDKIKMTQGRLYINGNLIPREATTPIVAEVAIGREGQAPAYVETLPNGVRYTIIEVQGDTGFNDNTKLFEIPPGQTFMMGDNRDNSTDSRIPLNQGGIGLVPEALIIGKVTAIKN